MIPSQLPQYTQDFRNLFLLPLQYLFSRLIHSLHRSCSTPSIILSDPSMNFFSVWWHPFLDRRGKNCIQHLRERQSAPKTELTHTKADASLAIMLLVCFLHCSEKHNSLFYESSLSFSESFFCSDSAVCGLRGSGMRNAARWKTQPPSPAANPEGLLASLGFLPQCYLLKTCCGLFFSECLISHSAVHALAWLPRYFAADATSQLLCKSDHKVTGWVYRKWERNM